MELDHALMETKFHDLPPAGWKLRDVSWVIQAYSKVKKTHRAHDVNSRPRTEDEMRCPSSSN